MIQKRFVKTGELYLVNFSPSTGHEFYGKRPALVIESNDRIQRSNVITVIPLTSNLYNKLPEDITIKSDKANNLISDSVLKVFNIDSFDCTRFIKKIGVVHSKVMRQVKASLRVHFGI